MTEFEVERHALMDDGDMEIVLRAFSSLGREAVEIPEKRVREHAGGLEVVVHWLHTHGPDDALKGLVSAVARILYKEYQHQHKEPPACIEVVDDAGRLVVSQAIES